MAKADVIVISYRSPELLARCLDSVLADPAVGRVLVVENGPGGIEPDLRSRFPGVVWRENRENPGFAAGVNQALEQVVSPYSFLLNPDAHVAGQVVTQAVQWMERNRDVGVLGPRILDPTGRVQGSARGFPSLATAFFGRRSLLSRLLPGNPVTRRNIVSSMEPADVDWVSGACMVVRMNAVSEVGPMDTRFFLYWEDCDWCTRFRAAGWRIVYHPGIGDVFHGQGGCSSRARLRSLYHFHKSAVALHLKYDRSLLRLGSVAAVAGGAARFLLLAVPTLCKACLDQRGGGQDEGAP